MQTGNWELFTIAPDGTARTQLTQSQSDLNSTHGIWSPDGSCIAFARWTTVFSIGAIHLVNADGTGMTELTDGYLHSWQPQP